ncbi:hypothetical protein ES703_107298 [subsurface metagenome]
MNQQIQPQETVQPLMVQALWVSQAIGILVAIGMVCYLLADVLKAGTQVIKK